MKTLYIVGGNGFAKECVQYIRWIMYHNPDIRLGGLVGHNGYKVDFGNLNNIFCGDLSEMKFSDNDYCIIGAGYPELRRKIYTDIKRFGGKLVNLCTPDVYIPEDLALGEGNCIIGTQLTGCTGIKIGNGNLFNGKVVIGHDTKIGDFNFFGPASQILGDIHVGNDNIIGANTIILAHAKIGNNNKIAPLSCVYKGCKDNTYMIGNPAEKVGTVK